MNLEDGLVTSIELPDGVSVNGKNMMRALASILQVDTSGHKMGMWTRKEVGYIQQLLCLLSSCADEHPWRMFL